MSAKTRVYWLQSKEKWANALMVMWSLSERFGWTIVPDHF